MGPTEKYLKRFEDDTVLDWFRARWERLADIDYREAELRLTDELGCRVYRFADLFCLSDELSAPAPESVEELVALIAENVYANEVLADSPHVLQVYTDDDDQEMAYFFFDDHFLEE